MEEQIKRAVRDLNISYVFFWVLPAFLLGAGEFDLLPVGALVDNPQATYYMETAGILLTALCVPLALKLFSLVLKKKIDLLTIPLALKRYVQWSMVRLGLLEVAIVLNVLCYYLTLSNTGNLCMLIGLTASLFCLPSEKRLRNELHINPHFCTVFLYHKFEHKYIPAQSFCITNLNISSFLHVENSIFHMCFHTKRGIALRHATFLFCHICFVFKTYCHARKILPVPTVPIIRLMQVLQ